ncbi:MAG: UDP-4-amino-4,6-dideoxy-N-acetyl-beta-L-altrosamine N-acetyltransferase [Candidatus Thermoplasmatota archaeon]|nr:UDP-4-amino-4,6-dideoxy-N-acetyl-beta-L-altrosamine N-acetyltransferase [Candidatus Thermoplasmatota archaeon]
MKILFENILNGDTQLFEQVRTWRNSAHVNQFMLHDYFITKDEHHQWLEDLKTKKNRKVWVIKCNEKPVGLAYLSNINYQKKSTDWGFYIAENTARGKGIGSLTLYKLMEYVFDILQFSIMHTFVLSNNPRAIRLYEKFGFRKDDSRTRQLERKGALLNVFSMSITYETWNNIKKNLNYSDSIHLK